jgi:hypothetical protein
MGSNFLTKFRAKILVLGSESEKKLWIRVKKNLRIHITTKEVPVTVSSLLMKTSGYM